LLAVGRLNARKNLARLVRALAAGGVIDPSHPLVVVGEAQGRTGDVDFVADAEVHWLQSVSSSELRWLYENATGFMFASLDEGYGLPPLEARAFGCPVAVSDIPVFRENLGDGALYFDPLDDRSIVEAAKALRAGAAVPAGSTAHDCTWVSVVQVMRREITRGRSTQRGVDLA
jgi:glycosyltransferase involved in cell wall biosynthesis